MLIVAVVLAFATTLDAPFFLDDGQAIERNPHILALSPLSRALGAPAQSPVSGRPLVSLSLALNYAAGGLRPRGYHVVNLALHAAAALLLWGIARRTLRSPGLPAWVGESAEAMAFAIAMLWAVHPLHTEVIAYVVSRTESLMAVCYLLTLYAAIRGSTGQGSRLWLAVAVAAAVLGALAKESIVTVPLMVLLYDVVFVAGSLRQAWRRRGGFHAALFATWGVLAWLHWGAPRFRSAGFSAGLSPWDYLLTQGPMILHYLRLAFWPHPLSADYGITEPTTLAVVWPAVAVVGALAILAAASWWRWRPVAFVATWVFVTLAPASSLVPIATEVGAERRMYLPLAGVIALAVVGGRTLLQRVPPAVRGRVASGVSVVLWAVLSATSTKRGVDYRDAVGIWESVLATRPHARAHHNLGVALAARGRDDEAIAEYRLAAETLPEARYSLGYSLAKRGEDEAAVVELREFLARAPEDALAPLATNLLGMALTRQGDLPGAIAAYERTLTMRPRDVDATRGLAETLTAAGAELTGQGRHAEATAAFARAVQVVPDMPMAYLNFGASLMRDGRAADAESAFRRGVALSPNDPALGHALAAALASRGARDEAIAEFERVLTLDPSNVEARAGLDLLRRGRRMP
jgi:protein O-mannosyl-transferase